MNTTTWLGQIFRRRNKPQPPAPGERWAFVPAPTPWPEKDYPPVIVLDVREGFVRYDMKGTSFRDERMALSSFLYCYRRVT